MHSYDTATADLWTEARRLAVATPAILTIRKAGVRKLTSSLHASPPNAVTLFWSLGFDAEALQQVAQCATTRVSVHIIIFHYYLRTSNDLFV
jgi:hypothetical protein